MKVRITERTLYPAIQKVFEKHGAKVITEVKKVTAPDFVAEWLCEQWIISIKIGNIKQSSFLKKAFLQYISHMRDLNIHYGMIIFYPEEIRKIKPKEEDVMNAIREKEAYIIVLFPQMELRKPLQEALNEVKETLRKKTPVSFNLRTVITILRAHIEEITKGITPSQDYMMKIIKDPKLFFGVNPIEVDEKKKEKALMKVTSFLSAYIFLSQMLFLRLYCEERPTFLEEITGREITRYDIRNLFNKIKNINYGPIFDIDVLDFIPEGLIQDTFKLLFGLQVKNIRYDLPGRLFHELIPENIRKLLAAFYTRPIAAYLLAQLTIDKADVTVFDPACGSGTILTMAYRRKLELWERNGYSAAPHKSFCEEQIYGCDIMPFAVHLTNANLVAMDPLTTIDLTQIILEDSLKLIPSKEILPGFITLLSFIPGEKHEIIANAFKRTGETVKITLKPVDVVLMNPPFTKIERGIKDYVKIETFKDIVGEEVGLWGHFVALADAFLKENGIFGAVLPINLLRGRESSKVREIVFKKWLPLYIIKASRNYGFSEYAEYRDVLVIAKKTKEKPENHKVKFCIIKKNLNDLTENEARSIAEQIRNVDKLRSILLDIDSYSLSEVIRRFNNMMVMISGPSLEYNEILRHVTEEAEKIFCSLPKDYFQEGYGPRPKGSSAFMFITRPDSGRTKEAFLVIDEELKDYIVAKTSAGIQRFRFNRIHFLPGLRTPVGLSRMDITDIYDYVAKEPYEDMDKVMELSNFKESLPKNYWEDYIVKEFTRAESQTAVVRRINPYSPDQKLIAFHSQRKFIISDLFHVIKDEYEERAKAVVVLLNSVFFLAYFFSGKEETTGRYIDVRQHDLYTMNLFHLILSRLNVLLKSMKSIGR